MVEHRDEDTPTARNHAGTRESAGPSDDDPPPCLVFSVQVGLLLQLARLLDGAEEKSSENLRDGWIVAAPFGLLAWLGSCPTRWIVVADICPFCRAIGEAPHRNTAV